MTYRSFLSFILILMAVITHAQNTAIYSLENELQNHQNLDSERLKILLAISKEKFGVDFYASEQLAIEAIAIATKLKDDASLGQGNFRAGRACIYTGKSNEGLQYFENAIKAFENVKDTFGLAEASKGIAIIWLNIARYAEAIQMFENSRQLYEKVGDFEGQAFSVMDIGITYVYLGNYESAIKYYFEALELAKASGKNNPISNVKNSIGQLYFIQEKYEECISYMQESLALAEEDNNLIVISDCNYYISRAKLKLNQFEDILQPISKSYKIDSIQSNHRGLVHKAILFGDIYIALGNLDKAQEYYQKASEFCDKIQDKDQNLNHVLIRLSNVDMIRKEYPKAINKLKMSVEVSKRVKMKDLECQALEKLAEVYSITGDYKNAFEYQKKFTQLKDSVVNEERVNSFNQLQALYQDEQKTSEIKRLNTESELQKANLEVEKATAAKKSQQNLLLIVGLTALIIVVLTLFKLFKDKEKSNSLLSKQNVEIEMQNQQKEILLKEIHHRVKNNLQVISSLLSLQSNDILDSNALNAVKEGQNRVKSIALIHQKLYQNEDLSSVDFDEYAEELVAYLRAALQQSNSNVKINVESHNLTLDIDTAVPLGLILNELVTNSLKYAFPDNKKGVVNISLKDSSTTNKLHLTVEDNGIGLPSGFDISKATSLGLKLVRMLCMQLDGTLQYSNGKGSKFDIEISNTELRKSIA